MAVRNKQGKFVKKTLAAKIRELDAKGMSRAEIAKTLNIRYQRVRNVLVPRVKPAEVAETEEAAETEQEPTESDLIEAVEALEPVEA